MKVIKGKHRIVFVLSWLGIVVKFPIVKWQLRWCFNATRKYLGNPRQLRIFILNWKIIGRDFFFAGIMDNWREFVFYIKTRHPFCEPTYFSFFGLLNIQRKAIPVPFDDSEFRKKCVDVMDRHIQRDNHHFEGTKNFSFRNGQLMMVDYGSPKTQGVIRDWGEKLMDNFHSNETPPLKK